MVSKNNLTQFTQTQDSSGNLKIGLNNPHTVLFDHMRNKTEEKER